MVKELQQRHLKAVFMCISDAATDVLTQINQ